METKYGRPKAMEQGFKNVFLLIMYVATISGLWFGKRLGVDAGDLYFDLTLLIITLLFIITLWVDETNRAFMKQYLVTPFSSSPYLSMAGWLLGWATIPAINFIGEKIAPAFSLRSFSTTDFFQSLYFTASGTNSIVAQSFSVAELQSTPFVMWFYSVFVAGTIEEFGWAFVLPVVFHTIAILLIIQFFDGKAPLGIKNENFCFIFAMLFSVITFMGIHTLNGSYVGVMFIVAGVFRLLMNSSVYLLGATASFVIGVHQSNNNTAFMQVYGMEIWMNAVFGNIWGLLIVFGFFLPAIVISLFNGKRIWEDFTQEVAYRFKNIGFNRG